MPAQPHNPIARGRSDLFTTQQGQITRLGGGGNNKSGGGLLLKAPPSDCTCPPLFAPLTKKELKKGLRGVEKNVTTLPSRLLALLRQHHTRALDLFRFVDRDEDGSITRDELEVALKCLGVDATRGDLDDFMSGCAAVVGEFDASSDPPGSLTFRTLQRALLQQSATRETATQVAARVKERREAIAEQRAALAREGVLQELLAYAEEERERGKAREAELEEEVRSLKAQLRDQKLQSDKRERELQAEMKKQLREVQRDSERRDRELQAEQLAEFKKRANEQGGLQVQAGALREQQQLQVAPAATGDVNPLDRVVALS